MNVEKQKDIQIRDRIVHHILIRRLNSTFEKYFINKINDCALCLFLI